MVNLLAAFSACSLAGNRHKRDVQRGATNRVRKELEFTIRYDSAINEKMRIIYRGEYLDIISIDVLGGIATM